MVNIDRNRHHVFPARHHLARHDVSKIDSGFDDGRFIMIDYAVFLRVRHDGRKLILRYAGHAVAMTIDDFFHKRT